MTRALHMRAVLLLTLVCVTGGVFRPAMAADGERMDTLNVLYVDTVPFVSLVELAETYHTGCDYDPRTMTMTLTRGGDALRVSALTPSATFNGASRTLGQPPRLIRGALYAPVTPMCALMSELVPGTLTWDDRKKGVRVTGDVDTITGLAFEQLANGTQIRFTFAKPLDFAVTPARDDWLTVQIPGGTFDPGVMEALKPSGLVRTVRWLHADDRSMVAFRTAGLMSSYVVNSTSPSGELVISLYEQRGQAGVAVPGTAVEPPPASGFMPDAQLWRIDTVVIDPGHGGRDPGAIGPSGVMEKDVVLAVALELKSLIEKSGRIKAVLTRDDDTLIPLEKRGSKALATNGKLFVSIHANASVNRSASGMEVYFLSEAKTDDAREVAQRENASVKFEESFNRSLPMLDNSMLPREVIDIQMGMISNVFLKESQEMCSVLLGTGLTATRQENRGVKQADFLVMRHTQGAMPSVLFEIGFLSNPQEEKLLNRTSYQKRLAQSIFDSITTFKDLCERDLFTTAGQTP